MPFRLTICGIPGLGEHCQAGVTHVLSILDADHPDPAAFSAFPPHHRILFHFNDIIEPEPGRQAPTYADVERLLDFGRAVGEKTADSHLLIHCHAGVSRSTASAALILAQAEPTRPAKDIFAAIVGMRPRAWPNLRILEFGDAILGRSGEIVAAASTVYRGALDREPYLQAMQRRGYDPASLQVFCAPLAARGSNLGHAQCRGCVGWPAQSLMHGGRA